MDLADGPGLKRSPNGIDGRVCAAWRAECRHHCVPSSQLEIKRWAYRGSQVPNSRTLDDGWAPLVCPYGAAQLDEQNALSVSTHQGHRKPRMGVRQKAVAYIDACSSVS